jgi:hypothetical protein
MAVKESRVKELALEPHTAITGGIMVWRLYAWKVDHSAV